MKSNQRYQTAVGALAGVMVFGTVALLIAFVWGVVPWAITWRILLTELPGFFLVAVVMAFVFKPTPSTPADPGVQLMRDMGDGRWSAR